MNKDKEGRTDLGHEPELEYKNIFYIVFSIAVLYLVIIMGVQ